MFVLTLVTYIISMTCNGVTLDNSKVFKKWAMH